MDRLVCHILYQRIGRKSGGIAEQDNFISYKPRAPKRRAVVNMQWPGESRSSAAALGRCHFMFSLLIGKSG